MRARKGRLPRRSCLLAKLAVHPVSFSPVLRTLFWVKATKTVQPLQRALTRSRNWGGRVCFFFLLGTARASCPYALLFGGHARLRIGTRGAPRRTPPVRAELRRLCPGVPGHPLRGGRFARRDVPFLPAGSRDEHNWCRKNTARKRRSESVAGPAGHRRTVLALHAQPVEPAGKGGAASLRAFGSVHPSALDHPTELGHVPLCAGGGGGGWRLVRRSGRRWNSRSTCASCRRPSRPCCTASSTPPRARSARPQHALTGGRETALALGRGKGGDDGLAQMGGRMRRKNSAASARVAHRPALPAPPLWR